jgi:thiol-disulfide isomerase/thioredoxin
LSDFRGKIVVISFWATWCGPCMRLVPGERELVQRMKGRPFVLVGVSGDTDRETARKIVAKKNIAWRTWWAGGSSGPIPVRWGVSTWPTLFVIDHHGVIRHANDFNREQLGPIVEKLVTEAEKSP